MQRGGGIFFLPDFPFDLCSDLTLLLLLEEKEDEDPLVRVGG